MSAAELHCIYDTHKPPEMVGHMRKDEFESLSSKLKEAKAKHAKSG